MARRKKKSQESGPAKATMHTLKLDDGAMEKVGQYCGRMGWAPFPVEYARFAFKNPDRKVNVVGYQSGKLVVSGKGTEDFVRDFIEPEVTGEARLGYDEVLHPDWYEEHAGMDEAGKGDVFGPLVTVCVVATPAMIRKWVEAGVKDSKKMNDTSILRLEKVIRETPGVALGEMCLRMEKYNELMARPRANLNRLLAWYHAKSITTALKIRRPAWGRLDQFTKRPLVPQYLDDDEFEIRMETKAESDPVVAAASICARGRFVREIQKLSEAMGLELKKGASAQVKEQVRKIAVNGGAEALEGVAKMHFRTVRLVLGLPVKEPYRHRTG